ncbi:MAG TPA: hypothetical protein PK466_06270 [Thermotogota bacterium]|nr:hypothetical protein [Thermotogota bacterium]HPR95916.1 hypothetical protein [Thermotogota bacterium]
MPSRNPFMSRVKRLMTGIEDNFNEELRNISGPKRIFQARTEAVTVGERLLENQFQKYSIGNLEEEKREIYRYVPFTKDINEYGIHFNQSELLKETTQLFYLSSEKFKDERPKAEIYTNLLMIVFWTNLVKAYFEHVVESEVSRLKTLDLISKTYEELIADEETAELLESLTLAFAFRNLSVIAENSGIPSGNPFDYQWVARYYIKKMIEKNGNTASDYIGDTRWYDGVQKLFHRFFEKDYYFSSSMGIDGVLNIPVYLITGDEMPAFETTIKSSPRTLDDVIRETNPSNRKFLREILSVVEYSFELSVSLSNDVGIVIEKGKGDITFEMYPQTYTHSLAASYCDIVCIPEATLERIRETNPEAIERLLQTGFEGDSEGKLTLVLDHKIGRDRWVEVLKILSDISGIKKA